MVEIGKRYGKLVCLEKDTKRDRRYYIFQCDCGNKKSIIYSNVLRGASKSCGCDWQKVPHHMTYGFSHTRLDNIYKNMISRCYYASNNRTHRYKDRGITVCDEWKNDKEKFFEWAFKNGYQDNLSIDRIDANGNYEPNNCRWATDIEQANNRSSNKLLTLEGKTMSLANWCREKNLNEGTVSARLKRGWSVQKSLTTPVFK